MDGAGTGLSVVLVGGTVALVAGGLTGGSGLVVAAGVAVVGVGLTAGAGFPVTVGVGSGEGAGVLTGVAPGV